MKKSTKNTLIVYGVYFGILAGYAGAMIGIDKFKTYREKKKAIKEFKEEELRLFETEIEKKKMQGWYGYDPEDVKKMLEREAKVAKAIENLNNSDEQE